MRAAADTVLIVQRRLTHYRVPLFEALRTALAGAGFTLRLAVGQGHPGESTRHDTGSLPWATPAPCHYAFGGRLCWQQLRPALVGAQYVVLPQQNALLAQWPLLLVPQPARVAVWGHGRNFQAGRTAGPGQAFRRALLRRADWAFAYTELSAQAMRASLPAERITVLNNAIDTAPLQHALQAARQMPRGELRRQLGLPEQAPVVLFIGALDPIKQLPLLIDSVAAARQHLPRLHCVVAGGGPLAGWLQQQLQGRPWLHAPGAVHGADKARWLAAADLLFNPGMLGLGVLDAFVAGLPLVSADAPWHSPEVAYLEQGVNALLAPACADALGSALLRPLRDPALAEQLRQGALASAQAITLPAMVRRFTEGLQAWRASARRSAGVPA